MKIFLVIIALVLIGCSSKEVRSMEGMFGHWKYRGSSTFPQIFQCVEPFTPYRNKEC